MRGWGSDRLGWAPGSGGGAVGLPGGEKVAGAKRGCRATAGGDATVGVQPVRPPTPPAPSPPQPQPQHQHQHQHHHNPSIHGFLSSLVHPLSAFLQVLAAVILEPDSPLLLRSGDHRRTCFLAYWLSAPCITWTPTSRHALLRPLNSRQQPRAPPPFPRTRVPPSGAENAQQHLYPMKRSVRPPPIAQCAWLLISRPGCRVWLGGPETSSQSSGRSTPTGPQL